jgi:hypothetical protein
MSVTIPPTPSCKVTVTGLTAGSEQVTTKLITGVSKVEFDITHNVMRITCGGTVVQEVGMDSFSSISATAASSVFSFTCS